MSDFSEALGACDPEDFTVIREDEGVRIDGIRRRREPVEFPGSGVFVPADAKTRERLDENTTTREVLQGFTETEVRTAGISSGQLADRLRIPTRGRTYEVREVSDWRQGSFFEILCVRLGQ